MKANEPIPFENMELLREIDLLKSKKNELYSHTGPSSSDYIDLSLRLDLLMNRYVEEKIEILIKN